MQKKIRTIFIIGFYLFLWEVLAYLFDNSIVLVGPVDTLKALLTLLPEGFFWRAVSHTLLQIAKGFLLAVLLGVFCGSFAYRIPVLQEVLAPLIALMKSIPVASFVILALIWLRGSAGLSVFVSFVVVFPMVYLSTISGLSAADRKLLEVCTVFRIPFLKRIRFVYLPALLPYLLTCFQTALGMSWKSGIAAELIGQPQMSIGAELYQAKIFLDTPSLFAWTFVIIFLSWLFEKSVLFLMNRICKQNSTPPLSKTEKSVREN